jgi:hypothetical protein
MRISSSLSMAPPHKYECELTTQFGIIGYDSLSNLPYGRLLFVFVTSDVSTRAIDFLKIVRKFGSSASLVKPTCLVGNDRMRGEIANQSDLSFGVLLCSHLHFSLFQQD